MSLKYTVILCLIAAIASATFTRFYFPSIQTKTVETTKEVIKNDVQTVVRTVTQPNGVVESTTTITDHSIKTDIDHKVDIVAKAPDWMVSGLYTIDIHTLKPVYGADIKYRLFDSLFIGGMVDTTGQPRVTLGITF